MWRHAVLQHGCFYTNGNQFMQVFFYITVRKFFSPWTSPFVVQASTWWSHARMVRVTALDIQVSLCNPTAMLEDSMTSVETFYSNAQVCDRDSYTLTIEVVTVRNREGGRDRRIRVRPLLAHGLSRQGVDFINIQGQAELTIHNLITIKNNI